MSLIESADGRPVHLPANPNEFKFDDEVSRIFPDMAERSIPNYHAAHYDHARMIVGMSTPGDELRVLDIGASHGLFLKELSFVAGKYGHGIRLNLFAIENSAAMIRHLKVKVPFASVFEMDLTSEEFYSHGETYDVVCMNYVLQFVRPEHQWKVLDKVLSLVRPGGLFVFGHKSTHEAELGDAAHERYISFRLSHGYTLSEIQAKTKALAGSMFPMDHEAILRHLKKNFGNVQETYRFMMFNNLIAQKRL